MTSDLEKRVAALEEQELARQRMRLGGTIDVVGACPCGVAKVPAIELTSIDSGLNVKCREGHNIVFDVASPDDRTKAFAPTISLVDVEGAAREWCGAMGEGEVGNKLRANLAACILRHVREVDREAMAKALTMLEMGSRLGVADAALAEIARQMQNTSAISPTRTEKETNGQPAQAHQGIPRPQPGGDRAHERDQGEGGGVRGARIEAPCGGRIGSTLGLDRSNRLADGLHGPRASGGAADDVLDRLARLESRLATETDLRTHSDGVIAGRLNLLIKRVRDDGTVLPLDQGHGDVGVVGGDNGKQPEAKLSGPTSPPPQPIERDAFDDHSGDSEVVAEYAAMRERALEFLRSSRWTPLSKSGSNLTADFYCDFARSELERASPSRVGVSDLQTECDMQTAYASELEKDRDTLRAKLAEAEKERDRLVRENACSSALLKGAREERDHAYVSLAHAKEELAALRSRLDAAGSVTDDQLASELHDAWAHGPKDTKKAWDAVARAARSLLLPGEGG